MYCINDILSSTFAKGWNLVVILIFAIIISIITITRNFYIGKIIDTLNIRDIYIYGYNIDILCVLCIKILICS